MIRSMTGFGRCQKEINGMFVSVEIKSVNHRYFEFSSRIPRAYSFLEEKLKSYVQSKVARGKIECCVSVEALDDNSSEVLVNHSLAKAYVDALNDIAQRYGVKNDVSAGMISRYPDVLIVRKGDVEDDFVWQSVKTALEEAIEAFVKMREIEGTKLKEDVHSRGEFILECVSYIEERSPETVKEYNEKLRARLNELLENTQIDEQRLITEAAIFADKIAVDEETVRLRSHIEQLNTFLDADEAIGRKMDFLIQEINREANTIGSKANNVDIARKVVEIKAQVEKIREQIQNIE